MRRANETQSLTDSLRTKEDQTKRVETMFVHTDSDYHTATGLFWHPQLMGSEKLTLVTVEMRDHESINKEKGETHVFFPQIAP